MKFEDIKKLNTLEALEQLHGEKSAFDVLYNNSVEYILVGESESVNACLARKGENTIEGDSFFALENSYVVKADFEDGTYEFVIVDVGLEEDVFFSELKYNHIVSKIESLQI